MPPSNTVFPTAFDLSTKDISERLGSLRLINPREQLRIDESIRIYGQLSPVVVRESSQAPFELIDGFKRLRAARSQGIPTLRARSLQLGKHAAKAAVVRINHASGRIKELEEALVLSSLAGEDGLSQKEIAELFERHRSWVSRRIALVERLCDEAREEIRLGLLSPASGRELARVPRGTQPNILKSLHEYNMTSREVTRLVSHLLSTPQSTWSEALQFPDEILRPEPTKKGNAQKPLEESLARLASHCHSVSKELEKSTTSAAEAVTACRYTVDVLRRTAGKICRLIGPKKREVASV